MTCAQTVVEWWGGASRERSFTGTALRCHNWSPIMDF